MQKLLFSLFIHCCFFLNSVAQKPSIEFRSSDTAMQNAFNEAKEMALHYKGNQDDPVGPWYEAALPSRYAFCMRDVSHQSIGGEILGMSRENKNMFVLFAQNISKSKDWCSYWEINKFGKPAPADYRNDKEFWYNLNANFDVIYACLRLYLWTGDKTYIQNPVFANFYEISAKEYIEKWVLEADSLLKRPAFPNAPENFNIKDNFHRCRGLASYDESVDNLSMSVDLVAAIYRGLLSYSNILKLNGDKAKADWYEKKAISYQQEIEADWWDNRDSLYNSYYTSDGKFGKSSGGLFLLWFDAMKDPNRTRKTIEDLIAEELNVESQSYLPVILYEHGYWKEAYKRIVHLAAPTTKRREYPEVSFGVMEGIVQGLMGIAPNAEHNRIFTIYRSSGGIVSELDNLDALGTTINVKHESEKTDFDNIGKIAIYWRAAFAGKHPFITVNNKKISAKQEKDKSRKVISFVDVRVNAGQKSIAYCTK